MTANEVTSADCGWRVLFAFVAQWPAAAEFWHSSRHEVALDTAWLFDQALRVAAGIPRKHASVGLWPEGCYCQRCGAFPPM
jgi:hypothetical protein